MNMKKSDLANIAEYFIKPITLDDLMVKKFKDTQWLADGLIPKGGIIAISGAPASFKTWLILDLGLCIGLGKDLFGKHRTEQGGVLLIDEENGEQLLKQRFEMLNIGTSLPFHILPLTNFSLSESNIQKVIIYAETHNITTIIFDSLVRIHSSDENDAMAMSKVFKLLKECTKHGITVIFTHHNRKQGNFNSSPSQSMRGSSDILASVDCHLAIERLKNNEIILTQTKLRQGKELKPFKLKIIENEQSIVFEYAGELKPQEVKVGKKESAKSAISQILGDLPNLSKTFLFSELKKRKIYISKETFNKAIKELVDDNELTETKGPSNTTICSLPTDESNSNDLTVV